MTAHVLVVDDEADVEALFRQQFHREVRQGLYMLDFACRTRQHSTGSRIAPVPRSSCWSPTSICLA